MKFVNIIEALLIGGVLGGRREPQSVQGEYLPITQSHNGGDNWTGAIRMEPEMGSDDIGGRKGLVDNPNIQRIPGLGGSGQKLNRRTKQQQGAPQRGIRRKNQKD